VLFLFSLIGIPLTAGFAGKMLLFFDALGLSRGEGPADAHSQLFLYLAIVAVVNAAVGAWYYLRLAGVMYLREGLYPPERGRMRPVLPAIWACALLTLAFGVYPGPLLDAVRAAVARPAPAAPAPPERAAAEG
jgi:NADH-quinone oxidoreductase subunit N